MKISVTFESSDPAELKNFLASCFASGNQQQENKQKVKPEVKPESRLSPLAEEIKAIPLHNPDECEFGKEFVNWKSAAEIADAFNLGNPMKVGRALNSLKYPTKTLGGRRTLYGFCLPLNVATALNERLGGNVYKGIPPQNGG